MRQMETCSDVSDRRSGSQGSRHTKKIDKEAAERRIQNWLSKMKRVLNRKTSSKDVSKDWKALSNFIKKGRAPPITAVLVSDQENQIEGLESAQKTHVVETNEISQQIEAKWEPVFNRRVPGKIQKLPENSTVHNSGTHGQRLEVQSKRNFIHEVSGHVWMENTGNQGSS